MSEPAASTKGEDTAVVEEPVKKAKEKPVQERRILSEDCEWNLAPVEKLTALCLKAIVKNFEKSPDLDKLPSKHRETVINSISIDLPLHIAGPIISDEDYWKRRSKARFLYASVANHGNSWKRLFFELHLKDVIEKFTPSSDESVMESGMKGLTEELKIGAPFVETLKLGQLRPINIVPKGDDDEKIPAEALKLLEGKKDEPLDHLNLGHILLHLGRLKDLSVYYGYVVFNTSVLDCGINFSWSLFGMTMKDAITFSQGLPSLNLVKMVIQASGVDDDRNLSHNQIKDSGARGVAKLLSSPKTTLQTLVLANNQISNEGVRCIGKSLQVNNTLLNLDLRLNHLYDYGGHLLFLCLIKNKTLAQLDVSGNGLENRSVIALAGLLKQNLPNLLKLDVSCNKLGDYGNEKPPTPLEKTSQSTANLLDVTKVVDVQKINDASGKILFEAISQNKVIWV
ncbi:T-complex-associated testis-expressed protein 1 [Boothiomyces macroporosus]|uniref:T-complex-associated testis-expressed protein 1 n=1 Tax=Boothiomyces macroporosus TaxID=261099 RepID=A0AAD5Y8M4_9FUNG|nr:T-complex-associated testis-expressed protein 1 [Boothiomyces macroporosus]